MTSAASGGEFSHSTAPESDGNAPSTGRFAAAAGAGAAFIIAAGLAFIAIVGALALIAIEGLALIIAPPPAVTTEDDGSASALPAGVPFIAIVGALPLIAIDGLAPIIAPPPAITTEDDGLASILPPAGWKRSTRLCSSEAVLASETWVKKPVSTPTAIATTATSTAAPRPRRTHSPAPSDRFIAANTRPPTSSASASDVAAPAA